MYRDPKTPWGKGYNAGFLAHEKHVAEGQVKRMEESNQEILLDIRQRENELENRITKVEAFEMFCKLIEMLK
jgi:hypothetical protein